MARKLKIWLVLMVYIPLILPLEIEISFWYRILRHYVEIILSVELLINE